MERFRNVEYLVRRDVNYQSGKGLLDSNTVNTHLINELDIPIAVVGIPNAVIVASPDGILVANKHPARNKSFNF